MLELYQVGIAFVALLVGLIIWAGVVWSKRSKLQDQQIPSPEFIEYSNVGASGYYVATTFADRPLVRVSGHGLGFAGKARVAVTKDGIFISRIGEKSFRIPVSDFIAFERSSFVIDKAVEKDGLMSLRWKLGEAVLESYLRFPNAEQKQSFESSVSKLLVGIK